MVDTNYRAIHAVNSRVALRNAEMMYFECGGRNSHFWFDDLSVFDTFMCRFEDCLVRIGNFSLEGEVCDVITKGTAITWDTLEFDEYMSIESAQELIHFLKLHYQDLDWHTQISNTLSELTAEEFAYQVFYPNRELLQTCLRQALEWNKTELVCNWLDCFMALAVPYYDKPHLFETFDLPLLSRAICYIFETHPDNTILQQDVLARSMVNYLSLLHKVRVGVMPVFDAMMRYLRLPRSFKTTHHPLHFIWTMSVEAEFCKKFVQADGFDVIWEKLNRFPQATQTSKEGFFGLLINFAYSDIPNITNMDWACLMRQVESLQHPSAFNPDTNIYAFVWMIAKRQPHHLMDLVSFMQERIKTIHSTSSVYLQQTYLRLASLLFYFIHEGTQDFLHPNIHIPDRYSAIRQPSIDMWTDLLTSFGNIPEFNESHCMAAMFCSLLDALTELVSRMPSQQDRVALLTTAPYSGLLGTALQLQNQAFYGTPSGYQIEVCLNFLTTVMEPSPQPSDSPQIEDKVEEKTVGWEAVEYVRIDPSRTILRNDSQAFVTTFCNARWTSGCYFASVMIYNEMITQVGFACHKARYNSDESVGVGDDEWGISYDAFRDQIFYNKEEPSDTYLALAAHHVQMPATVYYYALDLDKRIFYVAQDMGKKKPARILKQCKLPFTDEQWEEPLTWKFGVSVTCAQQIDLQMSTRQLVLAGTTFKPLTHTLLQDQ